MTSKFLLHAHKQADMKSFKKKHSNTARDIEWITLPHKDVSLKIIPQSCSGFVLNIPAIYLSSLLFFWSLKLQQITEFEQTEFDFQAKMFGAQRVAWTDGEVVWLLSWFFLNKPSWYVAFWPRINRKCIFNNDWLSCCLSWRESHALMQIRQILRITTWQNGAVQRTGT